MGFFKSLFGINDDDQQEFVTTSNDESDDVLLTEESTSTELNFHNFFGIDLTTSPNPEWIEDDYEFNAEGDKIRNFHYYGIDSDEWYFSDCRAKVIGNGGTNFFFEKGFDLEEAMDIIFLIERDLVHNGNYDYQKCIRKYRDKLDSIVPMLTWEFGDKSVMFDRDAITGDMKVSIWTPYYNSDFLGKEQSQGKIIKKYATTYELDYVDGQDHHQHKVIKNANLNSFVAGIKYRDNYEELLAKLEEGMKLQIKPEPSNEFDKDALAVYNGEDHLGYIPKKDIPAIVLNMKDGNVTAEIDYVDEEHIDLVVPVSFESLLEMSDEELEGFRFKKTERTKYETGYVENSSPISKEEFVEGIRQQKGN